MAPHPKTIPVSSWKAFLRLYEKKKRGWDGWVFRGQVCLKRKSGKGELIPSVESSLEREMKRFGLPLHKARTWEYRILREFRRRCHLVTTQLPELNNEMEWLALHFAVDHAREGDIFEVWALNAQWWVSEVGMRYPALKQMLKKSGSNSSKEHALVLGMKDSPGLWFLSPFRLNDRLAAQQGVFVLPLDVSKPFMENLSAISTQKIRSGHLLIYRATASRKFLRSCFKELHRMNICRATLYPGVGGLAQQMEHTLAMPHLFKGVKGELGARQGRE